MVRLTEHECKLLSSLHKLGHIVLDFSRVKFGFEHGLGLSRTIVDTTLGSVHPAVADGATISHGDGVDEDES